jgi:ATP-dependent Clp protease ATP-binding subunit ClpA
VVRRRPYCAVLFDEIEKQIFEVFNIYAPVVLMMVDLN